MDDLSFKKSQGICEDCDVVRGIHRFKCLCCGKQSINYANSIKICPECAAAQNACRICGKDLIDVK